MLKSVKDKFRHEILVLEPEAKRLPVGFLHPNATADAKLSRVCFLLAKGKRHIGDNTFACYLAKQ